MREEESRAEGLIKGRNDCKLRANVFSLVGPEFALAPLSSLQRPLRLTCVTRPLQSHVQGHPHFRTRTSAPPPESQGTSHIFFSLTYWERLIVEGILHGIWPVFSEARLPETLEVSALSSSMRLSSGRMMIFHCHCGSYLRACILKHAAVDSGPTI